MLYYHINHCCNVICVLPTVRSSGLAADCNVILSPLRSGPADFMESRKARLGIDRLHFRRLPAFALLAPLLPGACVVGPNFKPPAPPAVSSYTAKQPETTQATPGVPGGEAQRFIA